MSDHPAARLRRFNPWRRVVSAFLGRLVESAVATVVEDAIRQGRWRRRPRADDLPTLHRQVEAVIADLAHLYVARDGGSDELAISRDKGFLGHSRYRCDQVETQSLPRVLDALEASGLVHQTRGLPRYVTDKDDPDADDLEEAIEGLPANACTLRAAPKLLAAFQDLRFSAPDIGADDGRELLSLVGCRIAGGYRELIEYRDTAYTLALRAEIQTISAWLASFATTLQGDPRPAGALYRPLSRSFIYEGRVKNPVGTPAVFGLDGRLQAGFWQMLPEAERGRLRIDGEPVGIVDFERGQGPRPLRDENAILFSILLECKTQGLRALPMHRAILARQGEVERARVIIQDVLRERTWADANVSRHSREFARA